MAMKHLIEKIVALDPELIQLEDRLFPLLKQPAIIVSANMRNKTALIVFADETQCEVEFGKLIMLRRQGDIAMKLRYNWNIPTDEYKTITQVSKLMLKGLFADAIELALSSDTIRKYCTINCSENLKNLQRKILKRRM